jgi:hydrophobe/amphiphile efflux-1 (HAE1) family protein
MNLVEISIKRPILIIVLFLVLGLLGAFSYTQLRYELLPNISTPIVSISTIWGGASPAEIENGITKKIEEKVSTVEKIKRVTAQSSENVSVVTIEFVQDANSNEALQNVQKRVNELLSELPQGVKTPTVTNFSLTDLPVLRIAASANMPEAAFGELLKNQIKPQITRLKGVGQVTFIGLSESEIDIQMNDDLLRQRNISILQVVDAITRSNMNVPAGAVKDKDANYSVRVVGKTDDLLQLNNIVVATFGNVNIRLGEVAQVKEVIKTKENLNHFNQKVAVGINITKQSNANNVEISQIVRQELEKIEKALNTVDAGNPDKGGKGVKFNIAQDGSQFTLASAEAVKHDLYVAILLVAAVMFLFLHSIRDSLIVLVSIPVSLLSTITFMYLMGFSLNLLTLLAMSLVVGILVDDSIVVLENIHRHLEMGKDKVKAAIEGRAEIGFTAIAITLVDVVVFLPLSLAPGLIGDLMREFSLVIVIATLFSLLVCFTLVPMMSSRFGQLTHLTNDTLMGKFGLWFERQFDKLGDAYQGFLSVALRRRWLVALVCLGLFFWSFTLVSEGYIGAEFVAPADKGEVSMMVEFQAGQKLEQTDSLIKILEKDLATIPELKNMFTTVGADPAALGVSNSNAAELSLLFVEKEKRTKNMQILVREVKEKAAKIAGAKFRVSPVGLLGGGEVPIILTVSGADRLKVSQAAQRLVEKMKSIKGTSDLRLSGQSLKPEITVDIDRTKAALLNVSTDVVGASIRTALTGSEGLTIQRGNNSLDLRIILGEKDRNRTDKIAHLTVQNAQGQSVELRQFATIKTTFAPSTLERKDRNNAQTIYSQAIGRPVGDIGEDIKKAVAELNFDPSVSVLLGGDLELQEDSFGKLGLVFLAALILMYLVMVGLYNSWSQPFVVLFSIPLAMIGALMALAFTINSLNIFSILGLIMMMGLVAKNAILLVDRANHNLADGKPMIEALLEAGKSRLRPIVMTTLAMVIGMLPIAMSHGAGAELKSGLGWALIGGLSSSMFLTLIFVPTLFFDTMRLRAWIKGLFQPKVIFQKKNITTVLILLAILRGPLVEAQTTKMSLSMTQAVDLLKKQSTEIEIAKMEVTKGDLRIKEVKNSWLPTVSATAQYTRNIQAPVFFIPSFEADPNTGGLILNENKLQAAKSGLANQYNMGIAVAQPLFQNDIKIGQKLAENGREQVAENIRSVTIRQVAEVKKMYLQILILEEQKDLVQQGIERAKQVLKETKNLLKAELGTATDTLRAYVEVENQKPNLSKIDRNIALLKENIKVILNIDAQTELVLTEKLDKKGVNTEGGTLKNQSPNNRPELRQILLTQKANALQTDLEKAKYLPTISLFAQTTATGQMANFDFKNSEFPLAVFAGVNVNIPIFSPTLKPKIEQTKIAAQQTSKQLDLVRRQINIEVQSAKITIEEAQDRIAMAERTTQAAERSYALVKSRFDKGLSKIGEVQDAELALVQAKNTRLQAVYDMTVAQVDLERALGVD